MKLARFFSVALLFAFISACAGQNPEDNSPADVQDIAPGEKSVIQPPARANNAGQIRLEERNI